MKGMLSLVAAAAMVAAPAAQAQDETVVFRASGTWTADYGDDYCRLIRTFTDGQREFSLALERLQPGAFVRLIVVGEGMRPFRGADQIAYAFQPAGASGKSRYVRSETTDGKQYVSFDPLTLAPLTGFGPTSAVLRQDSSENIRPPAPADRGPPAGPPGPPPMYDRAQEQETARGITGFILTEGLISPVRVETGSLRAPIAELQKCADGLLTVWGLDADKHKTMTMMPIMNPNPSGVLPQGTVPFSEFGKLTGGANDVRLLIGADGKVTGCTVRMPSLSQSLNERICKLARERASFQPAKDAAGQPMASVWMGSPVFLGPPPPGGARRAGPVAAAGAPSELEAPPNDAPSVTLNPPDAPFGAPDAGSGTTGPSAGTPSPSS